MYYIFGIAKADHSPGNEGDYKEMKLSKSVLFIFLGLISLVFGGKWIVDGAVAIAKNMGVSESLIGLTIVAVGTSLPELATSAVAAYKKQSDIAIGNVVGSNIFNIFWILGISALIKPLPFALSSNVDILMVIFASLIMFFVMFVGKKHTIEKWQGGLMILIYAGYIWYLIDNK
jgi:cation:H+ antiporter